MCFGEGRFLPLSMQYSITPKQIQGILCSCGCAPALPLIWVWQGILLQSGFKSLWVRVAMWNTWAPIGTHNWCNTEKNKSPPRNASRVKLQKYIPAARFHFLTPVYGFMCNALGLGKDYRKWIVKNLKLKRGDNKLLDAGCGTGNIAIELK